MRVRTIGTCPRYDRTQGDYTTIPNTPLLINLSTDKHHIAKRPIQNYVRSMYVFSRKNEQETND